MLVDFVSDHVTKTLPIPAERATHTALPITRRRFSPCRQHHTIHIRSMHPPWHVSVPYDFLLKCYGIIPFERFVQHVVSPGHPGNAGLHRTFYYQR